MVQASSHATATELAQLAIGAEFAPLVSATLLPAADTSRLLVRVAPAPQPAFVAGDEFYLDDGELRQLVGPARDDYIEQRWQDY